MLYRDDVEAARAKAEALERALQRSMAQLERRLGRSHAAGNVLIVLGGVLGIALGFWLTLGVL